MITFLDEKLRAEETSTLIYAITQLQKKDETAENTKKIEGYQSQVYGKLIEKELLNNYSVQDVIEYLKRVHLLKIRGKTQFAEIPKKKSRKHIEKLEYVLPEEPITKKG